MEQLSIWALFDEYETPLMPKEQQKKDAVGWIIEFSGLFLRKNGFKSDWRGICTRPVIFERDTNKNGQMAHTIKGTHIGWCGWNKEIFSKRPTWNDCLMFAKRHTHKGEPEDVRYYDRTGDWKPIYEYKDGF